MREYLDSWKWDGTPRLDHWLVKYLGCPDNDYTGAVGSRWLISAVARVMQPGCKADCVLILEGPQGSYKSTALKILGSKWFTDELPSIGTKDSAMQTFGVWIIELAELESLTQAAVSKIKSFISRTTDRSRPPYGRRLIESPRQCVFAGSVNHSTYLRDETGGRRFWPVEVGQIQIDQLSADRDQLLAEAYVRYREGAPWWLDTPDLIQAAEQEQAARFIGDPWDSRIASWLEGRDDVSIAEVLRGAIGKADGQWTQPTRIGCHGF